MLLDTGFGLGSSKPTGVGSRVGLIRLIRLIRLLGLLGVIVPIGLVGLHVGWSGGGLVGVPTALSVSNQGAREGRPRRMLLIKVRGKCVLLGFSISRTGTRLRVLTVVVELSKIEFGDKP
jgi:hypothetical protein